MDNKYKPLSLMFVEYQSGDLIGFILAWCSMIPILYFVSLFTLIVVRRDLTTIFYFIGFLFNELINFVLKHSIKQPRPQLSHGRNLGSFSKHGMPSDHSQAMFYFSTFFSLIIAIRFKMNKTRKNQTLYKIFLVFSSFLIAFMVGYSRIYLLYHTLEQVGIGALLGVAWACVWFIFFHKVSLKYFHQISSWRICEFFMIRDYTHIQDLMLFQYNVEKNESNSKQKKVN